MIWRLRGIAASGALAIMIGACGPKPAHGEVHPNAPLPGLLIIKPRSAPEYKAVAAILTNRDVGDARARINGMLQRVTVREGDLVRRGQLLAVVLDRQLSLQAQAGSAGVGAAEAAAERAKGDLARYKTLYDRGFVAPAQMDALNAEARATDAQLRAARAQAGAAAAASNQGQVLAPANGRVTRLPIPQGAVVLAGDVVVAISTGARVLRIEVPESDAAALKQGQAIHIVSDDAEAVVRSAIVRQVYPAVANGRVTADLDASALAGDFVGARVRVLVPVGVRQTFIVPATYIATRFGVDYVRLNREGGAIDVPIQRGASTPAPDIADGVEVLSGLRNGDQILPADPGA